MNTSPATPVNHHAGRTGFGGPAALAFGVAMHLAGRRRARMVVDVAAVTPADRIIDIGCGSGAIVAQAARRGARISGVDPSPTMLRLARIFVRGPAIQWAEGTAERLPVPTDSATLALAVATVHHWPDVTTALAEVGRVLVPGGRFLTIERQVRAGANGLASHGWTEDQANSYADQCRTAGFADVRVERHAAGRHTFWAIHATRP